MKTVTLSEFKADKLWAMAVSYQMKYKTDDVRQDLRNFKCLKCDIEGMQNWTNAPVLCMDCFDSIVERVKESL